MEVRWLCTPSTARATSCKASDARHRRRARSSACSAATASGRSTTGQGDDGPRRTAGPVRFKGARSPAWAAAREIARRGIGYVPKDRRHLPAAHGARRTWNSGSRRPGARSAAGRSMTRTPLFPQPRAPGRTSRRRAVGRRAADAGACAAR
jgi:hypothetical protein